MLYDFSLALPIVHKAISIYLFIGFSAVGLVYYYFLFPYDVRAMSLKYLPDSWIDVLSFVIVMLISAWISYAIGEWFVLILVTLFSYVFSAEIFIKLHQDTDTSTMIAVFVIVWALIFSGYLIISSFLK